MDGAEQLERIKFRRARIEKRAAQKDGRGLDSGLGGGAGDKELRGGGGQQVQDSLAHLDKKKATGIDDVTSIRVEADRDENERRVAEEDRRQDRLSKLQEEAVLSGKRNAKVEMRWAELMDYNMPQDLLHEINAQKASCAMIIESKDKLIKVFQGQLKAKDEEYVKALKRQAEDIDSLLARMTRQYAVLQEEYGDELEHIEDAFLKEREELLQSNKDEIDTLFDQRRQMELLSLEDEQKLNDQHHAEIEALRVADAEEFQKKKIKLETDIQTLEQQLEEMRATYQLNTEKLEYNYRVLTERDQENMAALQQQRRKLGRLKEQQSVLMQKYHKANAADKKKNDELTDEYRRVTEQYKDLQSKFKHFEVSDNTRYRQIWGMHEDELGELAEKIKTCDRIVHEQQLGLVWEDPDTVTAEDDKEAAKKAAAKKAAEAAAAEAAEDPEAAQVTQMKVKAMLEMLASEAGFIVEASVQEALKALGEDEKKVGRADTILKALGVANEADVTALMGYFFADSAAASDDAEQLDKVKALGLVVKPNDVVKVIKKFVEDRDPDKGTHEVKLTGKKVSGATAMAAAAKEAEAARQEKDRREEKDYWDRMGRVLPEKTERVWSALEKALFKYNDTLKERAKTIDEVAGLQQQNTELKNLLSQYLGSRVNDDLIVPPTQMIKVTPSGRT